MRRTAPRVNRSELMQQVIKLLVLLLDPTMWLESEVQGRLPGTAAERDAHMAMLLSYKECFLDPSFPSAFASLLADAVGDEGA